MSVGTNIFNLRKTKNFSQEELAEKTSVTRETVVSWESDQSQPTLDQLVRLKDVFGVSVDEILCTEEHKMEKYNSDSLDTICAALAYAAGVETPACAAEKNRELSAYVDEVFGGERADRIVMYNPDAIAQWIYEKYPEYLKNATNFNAKKVYLAAVMPSVTPVCFGTMYTGHSPQFTAFRSMKSP